ADQPDAMLVAARWYPSTLPPAPIASQSVPVGVCASIQPQVRRSSSSAPPSSPDANRAATSKYEMKGYTRCDGSAPQAAVLQASASTMPLPHGSRVVRSRYASAELACAGDASPARIAAAFPSCACTSGAVGESRKAPAF